MKGISIPRNNFSRKYIEFYDSDSATQYKQRNIYLERKSMKRKKLEETLSYRLQYFHVQRRLYFIYQVKASMLLCFICYCFWCTE